MRAKVYKISREKAVEIAMRHNGVTREVAERYTDGELKEALKHASGSTYKMKADF